MLKKSCKPCLDSLKIFYQVQQAVLREKPPSLGIHCQQLNCADAQMKFSVPSLCHEQRISLTELCNLLTLNPCTWEVEASLLYIVSLGPARATFTGWLSG